MDWLALLSVWATLIRNFIIRVAHTDNRISYLCSPHWYKFYYQCGV